jgi:hypothetical protein
VNTADFRVTETDPAVDGCTPGTSQAPHKIPGNPQDLRKSKYEFQNLYRVKWAISGESFRRRTRKRVAQVRAQQTAVIMQTLCW